MSRHRRHAPVTAATLALDAAGIEYRTRVYEQDAKDHFGDEALEMLHENGARVLKTLVAQAQGELIIGIVPVTMRLDLKALAGTIGKKKASMCDPEIAQKKTGYIVGGISAVGIKTALPVVIDESVRAFETVMLSGGRRGFDIELAPDDLAAVAHASFARIAEEG